MDPTVSVSDVVAFRLRTHHLTERLGEGGLLAAAGRCGVQDSPPGSAALALAARVRSLAPAVLERALDEDQSLLRTWCMRGAPFVVPTTDAAVFTTGVLPPTEGALEHFLPGVVPALRTLDLGLSEAVELCRAEVGDVLAGRRLAIGQLGAELADRVVPRLSAGQRAAWQDEGPYARGQRLGEGVVHFCVRVLALQRVVCFAAREGNTAPFVLTDEWLGSPAPDADPQAARADLLRRYLRSYGPSTPADFAAWLGVRAEDAWHWWALVEDELTRVDDGRTAWVLTADLDALTSSRMPTGLRLLPPHDPYTQQRDRATIVDPAHHREVWMPVGDPGAVLADGRVVGTWRPRRSGRRLTLTVRTFASPPALDASLLRDEAEHVAALRGASAVDVVVDDT